MSMDAPGGSRRALVATAMLAMLIGSASTAGHDEGRPAPGVAERGSEGDTIAIDWDTEPPLNGELVDGPDGQRAVRVTGTGQPSTIELVHLDGSLVTKATFALLGQVRYSDVSPPGHLELLVTYADGGQYFSQGLTPEGDGALDGTSGWVGFELPFSGEALPAGLTLSVVLAGEGTVDVGPIDVVSMDSLEELAGEGAWWSDKTAGFIGAIGGTALGLIGAAYGVAMARGRHRRFVLASAKLVMGAGVGLLVTTAVALFQGQPYAVWFALLLLGVLSVGLALLVLTLGRKAFDARELQRMRAMDSG